ncbi:MAG: ribbon-helix-helix protein, CopG family [Caldilineae bacterium]|nr:ribbon-helix-helix protein, CopG family [Anaerolineae bacterium]MCB0202292.1 ribbon-helix-helix protein, CopG family [Anaerolineae bacterium]MCB0203216.1 ribbon-helix-helix protein, CopG family [Anaerolineae bacterium]MCB0255286.1 ribbon-helix-helix protein, CopG family [Anaerolineae bacterium]MCB9153680.1 ribbon-helix-helix protein, CopG family [Caldilineae bacterium]
MPSTMTKAPLQVYLRQDQMDSLRSLAKRQGVSLAELVRQGVDQLLISSPIANDPLWDVVGLGQSEAGDLAANHDRYLAELEIEDNRDAA